MILAAQGRTVRYVDHVTGETFVAIIVRVWPNDHVNLVVFDHNGNHSVRTSVPRGEPTDRHTWHAPAFL